MLVETLKHGRAVFADLARQWRASKRVPYLVIDTETQAVRPYPKDDALTIGRAAIRVWAICYGGSSYSFPTAQFESQYPTMLEWAELLEPVFTSKVCVVAHNWNYDANVFHYDAGLPTPRIFWDTMIGAWCAAEYMPKGLKERALLLGRVLRETKTVDFNNKLELAEYAEQDVVATEELYLLQRYSLIQRQPRLTLVEPDGAHVRVVNRMFRGSGKVRVPTQVLSRFSKRWLRLMELPILRSTIRAEQRGLPFDLGKLESIRGEVVIQKQNNLKELFKLAGTRFNPNSGKELGDVVAQLGIEWPFKTQKGALSFKEEYVKQMEDAHPFFRVLLNYRSLTKLSSVYIGTERCNIAYTNDCGLERWINPDTGAIHATAGTIEAVTGRGSSSRPNLQQIPARKDQFGVRHIFRGHARNSMLVLAPKYTRRRLLCVLDYSQLELRIMALLSGDQEMRKQLSDPKGDIHQHTADQFGIPRDPHAKNVNFLLLYGGQEHLLARELTKFGAPTDVATAYQYKMRHWEVYPRVKEKREEWCEEHIKNGGIKLFLGRTRSLPDADWSNDYVRHRNETRLANNAVQGTGQDFLKASILRSDYQGYNPDAFLSTDRSLPRKLRTYLADRAQQLKKYRQVLKRAQCRFLLQVHDEVIYSVVPSAANECCTILADIMTWYHFLPGTSKYNVPLVAEGGVGETWKAAKAKDAAFHVKSGFEHFSKFQL